MRPSCMTPQCDKKKLIVLRSAGLDGNHAGKAYRGLVIWHPEVHSNGVNFKFPGRGQRETPVMEVRGTVEVVMLLPGKRAALTGHPANRPACPFFLPVAF